MNEMRKISWVACFHVRHKSYVHHASLSCLSCPSHPSHPCSYYVSNVRHVTAMFEVTDVTNRLIFYSYFIHPFLPSLWVSGKGRGFFITLMGGPRNKSAIWPKSVPLKGQLDSSDFSINRKFSNLLKFRFSCLECFCGIKVQVFQIIKKENKTQRSKVL